MASVWVLAKVVGHTEAGEEIVEYFVGDQGENGGPSRSPFPADAYKFPDARTAHICADTHRELRDSDAWRVIEIIDRNRTRPLHRKERVA